MIKFLKYSETIQPELTDQMLEYSLRNHVEDSEVTTARGKTLDPISFELK